MEARDEAWVEVELVQGPVRAIELAWPADCGGEAVFLGRTRGEEHPELGALRWLEYACYEPMARKLLREMGQQAAAAYGVRVARIAHAVGAVPLGQASVAIQVAAAHRGPAFDACRHLIDRLKRELPIWKREHWERGQTFVPGFPVA